MARLRYPGAIVFLLMHFSSVCTRRRRGSQSLHLLLRQSSLHLICSRISMADRCFVNHLPPDATSLKRWRSDASLEWTNSLVSGHLSVDEARNWLRGAGCALDGIVAKRRDLDYRAGERSGARKIKTYRSADCVVGGFRYSVHGRKVGSLLA